MIETQVIAVLGQAAISQLATYYKERREVPRRRGSGGWHSSDAPSASDPEADALLAEYGLPSAASTNALLDQVESSPAATEAGFALSPDAVFQEARNRFRLFFRINVALCLAVSIILLGALGATIVLALMGEVVMATVFGVLTLGDIAFAAVYGPLDRIQSALVSTQRLDVIHLKARERLEAAKDLPPEARVRESNRIWADIQKDLEALSASS